MTAPNNFNSNSKGQSLITITNVIIMKKSEISQDYQNVTQRHGLNKCCWKNSTNRLDTGLPQTFKYKKHGICKTQLSKAL